MNSFAALMVIIACHADGLGCVDEPLSVISYNSLRNARWLCPAN